MARRRGRTKICVGGDVRRSTAQIKRALVAGLVEIGMSVVDVGALPTPTIYFAARCLDCADVAIVTASHNPGE